MREARTSGGSIPGFRHDTVLPTVAGSTGRGRRRRLGAMPCPQVNVGVFISVCLVLICYSAAAQSPAAQGSASVSLQSASVGYAFELLDGTPRRVAVELTVTGQASGESRFAVAPGWGGVTGVADLLHELA